MPTLPSIPIPRRRRSSIRRSTDADIVEIKKWIEDQKARDVHGTFHHNWQIMKKCHEEGKLIVYIDGSSGKPVAYQWGALLTSGILEVRDDIRGKGIGKKMVERRIADAYKKDECLLHIQCKPSTSIAFWQKMGFKLLPSVGWNTYAYRILEKEHELPADSKPVLVCVYFYPSNRMWKQGSAPLFSIAATAAQTSDGVVHLAERIFYFDPFHSDETNPVVEIVIEGKIHINKYATHAEAQRSGVRQCRNGFFIDKIYPLTT
ncbi:GNAT family N-acetyltransferase [Undibacterium sp. SXout11W]|uniref:GNAT family N-acetyltransferase n=1 Tax=Undibacterium sp. SXout11W TaxID=3413050 RepID=UPI003BF36F63